MINPKILEIDLTNKTFKFYENDELFDKYLGGIGVAIELLDKFVKPETDPLSPDNVAIFAIGPFNNFYPVASKTCAVFKSPLTGNLGESYAGGRLSTAMRFNNIGALAIKGKASELTYFVVKEDTVTFYNATPLSNMFSETAGRVIREKIGHPGNRSIVTIGPAGENLVPYSCATVDRTRHFGRTGLGAVLGSKNVKGFAIIGDQPISLEENTELREYNKMFREVYKKTTETDLMAKYHVLGTASGVLPMNTLKSLPTRNFRESTFEGAETISGEHFAKELLGKRVACGGCPIGCIHLAILRERWDKGTVGDIHSTAVPYDYELIYALGSNLGIGNPIELLKIIEVVEHQGLDAITIGCVLSWLAEAYEKNVISPKDTKGIRIRFGVYQDFLTVIPKIAQASKSEELYYLASKGVEVLAERYGGEDFAMRFGKVEPAGYSTGPYAVLGYSIGGRHSHLDNAGYSFDQKVLLKPSSIEDGVMSLIKEEEWRNVLNSLTICLFARGVYDMEITLNALKALKIEKTAEELNELGRLIHEKRLKFKEKNNYTIEKVHEKLPKRIYEMMTAHGKLEKKEIDQMFETYKKIIKERYNIK